MGTDMPHRYVQQLIWKLIVFDFWKISQKVEILRVKDAVG